MYKQSHRVGISWKGVISLLNLLLLVMLFFYLITKERERETKTRPEDSIISVNCLLNFSYKDNKLLDQQHFSERVGKKRAYSMADAMTNFLACITEDVPVEGLSLLNQFAMQLYACISLHIPIEKYEFEMFKSENIPFLKTIISKPYHFLPMDKTYYNNAANKCLYLTVGIGNHTQAEKEFLKLYPTCKLFGVEIAPSNVGDFGNFGKVIPVGIGFDGKETVQNYTYHNGDTYYNVTTKPFYMILDQEVGSIFLHYASINIEGNEHEMLKVEEFEQYQNNGIVICQMDIEWHLNYGGDSIKIMRGFFHNVSSYLPVFATPFAGGLVMKMTLINIKNPECELAFRFSKYFQR